MPLHAYKEQFWDLFQNPVNFSIFPNRALLQCSKQNLAQVQENIQEIDCISHKNLTEGTTVVEGFKSICLTYWKQTSKELTCISRMMVKRTAANRGRWICLLSLDHNFTAFSWIRIIVSLLSKLFRNGLPSYWCKVVELEFLGTLESIIAGNVSEGSIFPTSWAPAFPFRVVPRLGVVT